MARGLETPRYGSGTDESVVESGGGIDDVSDSNGDPVSGVAVGSRNGVPRSDQVGPSVSVAGTVGDVGVLSVASTDALASTVVVASTVSDVTVPPSLEAKLVPKFAAGAVLGL